MGCDYLFHEASEKTRYAVWRIFCALRRNKTPDLMVRRAANILNKHTNLRDCSQPPDHLTQRGFIFFGCNTSGEK